MSITAKIHTFSGYVIPDSNIRTLKAARQPTPPIKEIHRLLLVILCNLKLEKLTAAKMIKNPALPVVAMEVRSNTLATINVSIDVRIRPSIGLFHIFLSSVFGNSPDFAIM